MARHSSLLASEEKTNGLSHLHQFERVWNKAPLKWITTVLVCPRDRHHTCSKQKKTQIQAFKVVFFFLVDLVNCIKWTINIHKHYLFNKIPRNIRMQISDCLATFKSPDLWGPEVKPVGATKVHPLWPNLPERKPRRARHSDYMLLQPFFGLFSFFLI